MRCIDLNNDVNRQILVDREEGQYLGHVSSVLLEDGKTIVAVYPKGHGRGPIILKKSFDGGLTWTDRLPLPDSFKTSLEVPTIFRMKDESGKERIILFTGHFPIRTAMSEDDGDTWTELKPLDDYGGIVAMGDVIALDKPGSYMALFHDEINAFYGGNRREKVSFLKYEKDGRKKYIRVTSHMDENDVFQPVETALIEGDDSVPEENGVLLHETTFGKLDFGKHFHVNKIITRDGGLTWSQPQTIARHPVGHLCEPGMIRLNDGRIAVLLRENSRRMNSCIMYSFDEGQTFTKPVELPDALTGDRHTCRRLNDGRIAITFRDMNKNGDTHGDWVLWIGMDEDLINRTEGQYHIRLKDNYPTHCDFDCAYPGMHVLPDGTIVTLTYGHWRPWKKLTEEIGGLAHTDTLSKMGDTQPYILCVRLHPDELENM